MSANIYQELAAINLYDSLDSHLPLDLQSTSVPVYVVVLLRSRSGNDTLGLIVFVCKHTFVVTRGEASNRLTRPMDRCTLC